MPLQKFPVDIAMDVVNTSRIAMVDIQQGDVYREWSSKYTTLSGNITVFLDTENLELDAWDTIISFGFLSFYIGDVLHHHLTVMHGEMFRHYTYHDEHKEWYIDFFHRVEEITKLPLADYFWIAIESRFTTDYL